MQAGPRSSLENVRTGLTGLEPAASGVTDRHSNQLSYSPRYAQHSNVEGTALRFKLSTLRAERLPELVGPPRQLLEVAKQLSRSFL